MLNKTDDIAKLINDPFGEGAACENRAGLFVSPQHRTYALSPKGFFAFEVMV